MRFGEILHLLTAASTLAVPHVFRVAPMTSVGIVCCVCTLVAAFTSAVETEAIAIFAMVCASLLALGAFALYAVIGLPPLIVAEYIAFVLFLIVCVLVA